MHAQTTGATPKPGGSMFVLVRRKKRQIELHATSPTTQCRPRHHLPIQIRHFRHRRPRHRRLLHRCRRRPRHRRLLHRRRRQRRRRHRRHRRLRRRPAPRRPQRAVFLPTKPAPPTTHGTQRKFAGTEQTNTKTARVFRRATRKKCTRITGTGAPLTARRFTRACASSIRHRQHHLPLHRLRRQLRSSAATNRTRREWQTRGGRTFKNATLLPWSTRTAFRSLKTTSTFSTKCTTDTVPKRQRTRACASFERPTRRRRRRRPILHPTRPYRPVPRRRPRPAASMPTEPAPTTTRGILRKCAGTRPPNTKIAKASRQATRKKCTKITETGAPLTDRRFTRACASFTRRLLTRLRRHRPLQESPERAASRHTKLERQTPIGPQFSPVTTEQTSIWTAWTLWSTITSRSCSKSTPTAVPTEDLLNGPVYASTTRRRQHRPLLHRLRRRLPSNAATPRIRREWQTPDGRTFKSATLPPWSTRIAWESQRTTSTCSTKCTIGIVPKRQRTRVYVSFERPTRRRRRRRPFRHRIRPYRPVHRRHLRRAVFLPTEPGPTTTRGILRKCAGTRPPNTKTAKASRQATRKKCTKITKKAAPLTDRRFTPASASCRLRRQNHPLLHRPRRQLPSSAAGVHAQREWQTPDGRRFKSATLPPWSTRTACRATKTTSTFSTNCTITTVPKRQRGKVCASFERPPRRRRRRRPFRRRTRPYRPVPRRRRPPAASLPTEPAPTTTRGIQLKCAGTRPMNTKLAGVFRQAPKRK